MERVGRLVGDLWAGITEIPLPTELIVVSDLLYSPNPETTEELYAQLKGKSPKFDVCRRQRMPERWHYRDNPRIGDLVGYVHGAYVASIQPQNRGCRGGTHGFDESELKTMDAIF